MNEDVLKNNEYRSRMNLDNFPSHQILDESTGEMRQYYGASKYFKNVDPKVTDPKSLHNASCHTTYLLLKNRNTQEWEFPTTEMYVGETFLRAKQNILNSLLDNEESMLVKYLNLYPSLATLRQLTEAEQEEDRNYDKKGVRTYYFEAHHWRGLPTFHLDKTKYEDFAWVPKLHFRNYMQRDYFDIFGRACSNRW